MIDDINSREKGHILTIEDPIEFVHARKNCLISQREIGVHAASFASALQSALREDPTSFWWRTSRPRDHEHRGHRGRDGHSGDGNSGIPTAPRPRSIASECVSLGQATHVRTMLSTSLRGVVSQQLIPRPTRRAASRPSKS